MKGWIKLHRQIVESAIWTAERFSKGQAWIDLLLLANHKPQTISIRGIELQVLRGQLAYSQVSLARRWGWNFKTIVTFLRWLENRDMVETRANNQTTVITIKNYSTYQTNGEQNGDQNGDQKETRTETDKNVKNEKHVNNLNTYVQGFENFYGNYPKKKARQDAFKAWQTLNPDGILLAIILDSLSKFKKSPDWTKENGKYIPLPASWLRGRRWEDEGTDTATEGNNTCSVCKSTKWRTLRLEDGNLTCDKCVTEVRADDRLAVEAK